MSILCLWSPVWPTDEGSSDELTLLLLEEAPRVVIEGRGVIWVDAGGLPADRLARRLLERFAKHEVEGVRIGGAIAPIVAEGAARFGEGDIALVPRGEEARLLASCPLHLLTTDERLLSMLAGVGIRGCGDLADLSEEAAEVRFGNEGVKLRRLARGDDPRLLFRPIPPERPHASVDFIDYTVQDATRLVFTLNALLDQVCGILRERARRARSITLTFALAGGGEAREVLRTARPTADRALWIRRLRTALEQIKLPDSIAGVSLEAGALEPISALQGDLFDRGFATATFVEEAVGRLLDLYRGLFARQISSQHPLAERRTRWTDLTPQEATERKSGEKMTAPALELQLLSEPRHIRVRTRTRRDHVLPIRYMEGKEWHDLTAAGPDRISGGHEEKEPYAREYYRCASNDGALLWIYRDAVRDRWFLHGWWD